MQAAPSLHFRPCNFLRCTGKPSFRPPYLILLRGKKIKLSRPLWRIRSKTIRIEQDKHDLLSMARSSISADTNHRFWIIHNPTRKRETGNKIPRLRVGLRRANYLGWASRPSDIARIRSEHSFRRQVTIAHRKCSPCDWHTKFGLLNQIPLSFSECMLRLES